MKLAREVAHTTDVDGMLDRMAPEQFSEWLAMYSIWESPPEEPENKPGGLAAMRQLIGV
jgi:hypothetical protein